jgi:hypothetical protein
MRETLKNILFLECPTVFSLGKLGMDAPAEERYGICFGVECGDGWFEIIREASVAIEKLNREHNANIVAHQIKEKFGTLRYYTGSYPAELSKQLDEIIDKAEKASETTCEKCGATASTQVNVSTRTGGWWTTQCDSCYEQTKKKDKRYKPDDTENDDGE